MQIAFELGLLNEDEMTVTDLNHLYGYVGQNPASWMDPFGLAAKGNYKLDHDQVNNIKERLKDPKLDKKIRNELDQKLKRHEKATGTRPSRISKDKILKGPSMKMLMPLFMFDVVQEMCKQGIHSGAGCLPENQPDKCPII